MKILMFGWEFPPYNSGGLGVACKGLATSLSQRSVSVSFVLPKRTPLGSIPCKFLFADDDSNFISLNKLDVFLMPYMTQGSYSYLKGKIKDGPYALSLIDEVRRYGFLSRGLAKNNNFDVIHAHDWLSFKAGVEAKRVSGKPLIVHVHATEFDRSGGNINQEVYEIEKEGMKEADKVITVSNFTKNVVKEKYGIPDEKISVVHNGIEEGDYNTSLASDSVLKLKRSGYNIVLFLGRITIQKGPDYFVKMAKKVLEYEPNTFFVVSGCGDMEGQVIREVLANSMSNRFIFTGFLRGQDLSAIYKAADIYIMPSVSEPFGLTPLESMIHKTPTLISKQAGVSEVISHALKSDFWDIDDMANKVVSVLRNKPLRKCLSENGCREARSINWGSAADSCINIYKDLIKRIHHS